MVERRTLWLIRHADASPPQPGQNDFDRPLSPRGEQEVTSISNQLKHMDLQVDWMLVSSARRTAQTAATIAPVLGLAADAVQLEPDLFHAHADGLLDAIRSVPADIERLAVVSHNPGLSELATRINQGQALRLPTLGCCCFITLEAVVDWSTLGFGGFQHLRTLHPETSG
ncbi:MAG: histidine phosphatase family protein [Pseudomonadota bacterium]